MLATDFGIDSSKDKKALDLSLNLCESCHYKLVACTEVQTVFSNKVVEETGASCSDPSAQTLRVMPSDHALEICMCTGYEPSLSIPRVNEYIEAKSKTNTQSKPKDVERDARS